MITFVIGFAVGFVAGFLVLLYIEDNGYFFKSKLKSRGDV